MVSTKKAFCHVKRPVLLSFVLLPLALLLTLFKPCPPLTVAREALYHPQSVLPLGPYFPFYQNGKTYLFGQFSDRIDSHKHRKVVDNAANWWVINDDPSTGFAPVVKGAKMSSGQGVHSPFVLGGDNYIFSRHNQDWAWRINDEATGIEPLPWSWGKSRASVSYQAWVTFQLNGVPYLLGLHSDVGANIWRIEKRAGGPRGSIGATLVKYKAQMSPNYKHLCAFYLDGHPYIFGVHKKETFGTSVDANIWRVKEGPSQGIELELVMKGAEFSSAYDFVWPFQLGGRPYLFVAALTPESYPNDRLTLGVKILESLIKWEQCIYEPGKGYGAIWEIAGDPRSPSIRRISRAIPISHRYYDLVTFEQGGKVYIFGVHEENYGNIWAVNEDPAKGFSLVYYGRNK